MGQRAFTFKSIFWEGGVSVSIFVIIPILSGRAAHHAKIHYRVDNILPSYILGGTYE